MSFTYTPLSRRTLAQAAALNAIFDAIKSELDGLPSAEELSSSLGSYATATGTDNIAATLTVVPTAYDAGLQVRFFQPATNTGAMTINVNGLGVRSIVKADGSAMLSGEVVSGQLVDLTYNGTNFVFPSALVEAFATTGKFADGTVSLPGISFTLDTDTGIYRPGDNQVAVAVGGAQVVGVTSAGMSVTGLISGTAVTQTTTDTTAGRLMKPGDFGLGAASTPSLTDLTAEWRGGLYRFQGNTGTGGPDAGAYSYAVVGVRTSATSPTNAGHAALVWRTTTTLANAKMFVGSRSSLTGALTWAEVVLVPTCVGTVSQTDGVPDGSLFEEGSSANGEYLRIADGRQFCSHIMTASSGAATTWTFPAAFVGTPKVTATAVTTVCATPCLDTAPVTTSASFSVRDAASARRADVVHIKAEGRWY